MHIKNLSRRLIALMGKEILLLNEFEQTEQMVRQYIRESDWGKLNTTLKMIDSLSDSIDEVEEQRHSVYQKLRSLVGEGPNTNFYQVVVHLDPETREECASLYRGLKMAVIKIQGITWSIDAHIRAVSNTIGSFLDEVFPHRKGRMYSKQGTAKVGDTGPMVVNQSL